MEHTTDISAKAARLSELIADKIGPRGPDLTRQVRRAGRRLPKSVRRDVLRVAEAAPLSEHPKLVRQISADTVQTAFARAHEYLIAIDKADRRKGALLSWLGGNAFNLGIVFVSVIVVLRMRGHL